MNPFSRRRFLGLTASSLVAAPLLRAVEPFKRGGPPRFPLSLAAYSFRDVFKETRGKVNPTGRMDILDFVNYCADQGWPGAELTSYFFPTAVTTEYLLKVRRQAFLRGVEITGTSVGNNFALPAGPQRDQEIADVKRWIDHAAVLGAPHIRVFAGASKIDAEEAKKLCITALQECADYAGAKGIFLGLENHGGLVAEPEGMIEIVQAVQSPWFGVNLDTGNFHGADPYAQLALCAPYAVNVQIKAEIKRAGAKEMEPADFSRLAKILRDANYQGWVVLEYEAKEDPYKSVPPLLVKMRGVFGGATAGATAQENWKPIFDGKSLDGWKATDFSGQGEVRVQDGVLTLGVGNDITGLNYAGENPKTNYEIALEAKRVQGTDFFCGLTLPYGDAAFTIILGGWGGALVGLSSINGDDASENETTKFLKFDQNRWYRVRVRVTSATIEAWLDDDPIVNVETEGKKIDMRPGEIELSKPFGLASFRTEAAYRDIKLRRIEGGAK